MKHQMPKKAKNGIGPISEEWRYHKNNKNNKKQLIHRKTIPKIYHLHHKTRRQLITKNYCMVFAIPPAYPWNHCPWNNKHRFQQVAWHLLRKLLFKWVNSRQMTKIYIDDNDDDYYHHYTATPLCTVLSTTTYNTGILTLPIQPTSQETPVKTIAWVINESP